MKVILIFIICTLAYVNAAKTAVNWSPKSRSLGGTDYFSTLRTSISGVRRANTLESRVGCTLGSNGCYQTIAGPSCVIGSSDKYFQVDTTTTALTFCVGFVANNIYYADAYVTSNGKLSEAASNLGTVLDLTFTKIDISYIHFCTSTECNAHYNLGLITQSFLQTKYIGDYCDTNADNCMATHGLVCTSMVDTTSDKFCTVTTTETSAVTKCYCIPGYYWDGTICVEQKVVGAACTPVTANTPDCTCTNLSPGTSTCSAATDVCA